VILPRLFRTYLWMMAQGMVAESGPGGPVNQEGILPGDRRQEFEQMYDTYMPKIYRYISYRTGSQSVAEDLTSDVFEKALKHFDTYRKERASQATWLTTIARNTVTDHFRKESRVQVVREDDAPEEESGEPPVDDQVERLEEVRQLRLCLAVLPQLDQDIISLKFGAGLNNREIARALSVSESNVGTRLFRSVRRLRDSFKGWEHDTQR
jgi:RNA polymerase sigma factor (sigma-70 family)